MRATARGRAIERFYDNRLFEGVDAEIIERIAPKIGVLRKKPGETIFREGEPGDSLYLVGQGCVKIAKAADGVTMKSLTPSTGEISLAQRRSWPVNRIHPPRPRSNRH